MILVLQHQKICPKCKGYLEPEIFSDPKIDVKQGNPWFCKKCNEIYLTKEISYKDHIELIKKYYLKV